MRGVMNREISCLKTLYENYACSLNGMINMIVKDEESRNVILEKTFLKAWEAADSYNPVNDSVFIWLLKFSIKEVSQHLEIQMDDVTNRFWKVYAELRNT